MKEINLENYELINYRKISDLITAEFLNELYGQYFYKVNPVYFKNVVSFYENGIFRSYAPKNEWNNIRKFVGNQFLDKNKFFLNNLKEYLEVDKSNFENFIKTLKDNVQENSDIKDLVLSLIYLQTSSLNEIYPINLVQIEQGILYAIIEELKIKYGNNYKKYIKNYIGNGESEVVKAKKYLDELSEKVNENLLSIDEAINNYITKYGNISLGYGDYDGENLDTKVKKYIKNESINNEPCENSNTSEITNDIYRNDTLDIIKKYSEKISEFRDRNKHFMGIVSGVRNEIINKISKLENIERESLSKFKLEEFYKLAFDKDSLDMDEILKRNKIIILKSEKILVNENLNFKNKLSNTERIMDGVPVSSGKVAGNTIHFHNNLDPDDVKGKILVTQGTDFNMMEYIFNCSGLLVEEGGILSHASIIAREIEKPCIVGIKDIYRRINNGSLIYLNGDDGNIEFL